MNKCLICGASATTREHLIKRTTIEELMFKKKHQIILLRYIEIILQDVYNLPSQFY